MSPLRSVRSFFASSVEEIRSDKALTWYGAFLGIPYLATAAYFFLDQSYLYLSRYNEGTCWPFFPDCYRFHVLSVNQALAVIGGLGALAVAFSTAFLFRRARVGYVLLL